MHSILSLEIATSGLHASILIVMDEEPTFVYHFMHFNFTEYNCDMTPIQGQREREGWRIERRLV